MTYQFSEELRWPMRPLRHAIFRSANSSFRSKPPHPADQTVLLSGGFPAHVQLSVERIGNALWVGLKQRR
jgi:hypothetical protein